MDMAPKFLAVADGVVTAVVADLPEPTIPVTPDNAAGNYVTIDLGGGRFASYEHVQPHSITVKVGDQCGTGRSSLGSERQGASPAALICTSTSAMPIHRWVLKVSRTCSKALTCSERSNP
jgi:hypothetical protein